MGAHTPVQQAITDARCARIALQGQDGGATFSAQMSGR